MKANNVKLTAQQQDACDAAVKFARTAGPKDSFVLSGLAGTGKTTTLLAIVDALIGYGLTPSVSSPTGKAAHVINQKQDVFLATTIHRALTGRVFDSMEVLHQKLRELENIGEHQWSKEEKALADSLYKQIADYDKQGGNLTFSPVSVEDFTRVYDVMIFDESSMIGHRKLFGYIERIPLPRIYVGDGAQLRPVKDRPVIDWDNADVKLTEILRQQDGNEIIKFAHCVHNGKTPRRADFYNSDDVTVVGDYRLHATEAYMKDHQFIVWRNPTRHMFARHIRSLRRDDYKKNKYQFLPCPGEVLMCDDNIYKMDLLKGQLFTVKRVLSYDAKPDYNPYLCYLELEDEDGERRNIEIDLRDMCTGMQLAKTPYEDEKRRRQALENRMAPVMQWGYALTCHKAQGSEWDKVVMVGDMLPGDKPDWTNWWYTAATRARKKLVVASYLFNERYLGN